MTLFPLCFKKLFKFTHAVSFLLVPYFLSATSYYCSSVEEIRSAVATVVAGDEIVIAPGTYQADNVAVSNTGAHFAGFAEGTAQAPITIRSADPSDPAILSGSVLSNLTVLRIYGDHWIVKDLKITYAQKGLLFENSNYSKALIVKSTM